MSFLPAGPPARPQVCFLFIAQRHQMLHGVSLAVELARSGMVDVHAAVATRGHFDYLQRLVRALGGAHLTYHRLWPEDALPLKRRSIPPKAAVLALNLPLLRRFDVIVTPERTSLMLKSMGLRRQIFVHTDHGAGDRAVGYEARIAQFDLVLLAGEKQRERMGAAGLIREGDYAVVGYPKFDVVDSLGAEIPQLFEQARPTVLYNPHFSPSLSSWPGHGMEVLEQFAASPDYNLIFAPHVRLFDGAPQKLRRALQRYADAPNIHVDLGGERACDMTYTRMADVYLGDVSSQVYEFLRTPRPCLFIDAHGVDWRGDENYAHWAFGPVVRGADGICEAVGAAREAHGAFRAAQVHGFSRTFDLNGPSSQRAAAAIIDRVYARRTAPARIKLQPVADIGAESLASISAAE
jgi:hypothetical protein